MREIKCNIKRDSQVAAWKSLTIKKHPCIEKNGCFLRLPIETINYTKKKNEK